MYIIWAFKFAFKFKMSKLLSKLLTPYNGHFHILFCEVPTYFAHFSIALAVFFLLIYESLKYICVIDICPLLDVCK